MPFATFLVALLAGMGVGSGGLFIVYLTLLAGVPQVTAQGLNLWFFIFATSAAMLLHARQNRIPWKRLFLICFFGAFGCFFGAYLTGVLDRSLLRTIFALLLIFTGAYTLFRKKRRKSKKLQKTLYK